LTEVEFDQITTVNNTSYIFKLRIDYTFHGELSYDLLSFLKKSI